MDGILSILDLASYLFAPLELRATKERLPKLQLLAATSLRSWYLKGMDIAYYQVWSVAD